MAKETKAAAAVAPTAPVAPTETPVSTNPAMVEFPRDVWGMTTELRKAGLRAASAVRGNAEKHKLFLATLRVLAQHSAARLNSDAEGTAAHAAKIAARAASAYQRVASHGVQTPVKPA